MKTPPKSEVPHKQEKTLADRVRSSLVLKLNVRMIGSLISAFLTFNLLASFFYFGIVLWKAEEGARRRLEVFGVPQVEAETFIMDVLGYEMTRIDTTGRGILLPEAVQSWLPLETEDARRWISSPGILPRRTFRERADDTNYHMTLYAGGTPLHIAYNLSNDIQIYLRLVLITLLCQSLYLANSIGTNNRMIKKTLKPLSELAATARNLQQEMAGVGNDAGSSLQSLAGALSTIDAGRLDHRIAVDSDQHELMDLARAINDMLNRINQSYQSQARFVSDASHELRTPISVIQGYAGLLDRWGKEDESVLQESIDAIKSETANMKALVEQLLFLARGDNDTMTLHMEPVDVCSVVEEILRETKMIDPHHHFTSHLVSPSMVMADQQLIKQAVRVLVDNSVKYTPVGETISMKVYRDKEEVRIQVQDQGIGIAPDDVSHIFDRFYRSDESRARKTGGAGLGLAIAKWIVERHEGHLEVISRVDIGTRTTIVMPALSENIPVKTT